MAAKVDYQLQDAEALLKTVYNNREAMNAKGFSDASHTALVDAKENLLLKEAAQQKAVQLVADKTAEQNQCIENVSSLIKRIRSAAKSAYGNDEKSLKLFKVGEKIPSSVKKLRPMCEYIEGLVLEHHDILLQNGLVQADIDELHSSYGNLVAVDATQENAKKLQVAATLTRDDAAKKLKDKVFRVRNFANACFAKDKEILVQFQPVAKSAGGRNGGDDDANASQPPDAPKTN